MFNVTYCFTELADKAHAAGINLDGRIVLAPEQAYEKCLDLDVHHPKTNEVLAQKWDVLTDRDVQRLMGAGVEFVIAVKL